MLSIISAPNEVLAEKAKPIKKIDKSVLDLIEQMKKTLASTRDPEGIGLAAPQVGVSLQLFIIKPTPKAVEQVFINPVVITQNQAEQNARLQMPASPHAEQSEAAREQKEGVVSRTVQRSSARSKKKKSPTRLEGCLSLPQIWGEVMRYPTLSITYLDPKNNSHTEDYSGFVATIIQHEYDHLQGILFPRRVLEQKGKLYKSKKDDKGEEIFDEISI